ncbi:MAG: hypothetical protein L6R19_15385 [Alphaproteobacteria bacterium]|nr:hypothetical protein [Alphaproteobacteria bacterium]
MLALAAGTAGAVDRQPSAYAQARYAMNVAEQCGLVTPRAEAGFAAVERRLIAEEGLDTEGVRNARIAAGIAFAREYQNRGLGGARPWCSTEGAEAVRRFEAVPLD